jgi:hypothetical protein
MTTEQVLTFTSRISGSFPDDHLIELSWTGHTEVIFPSERAMEGLVNVYFASPHYHEVNRGVRSISFRIPFHYRITDEAKSGFLFELVRIMAKENL